MMQISLKIVVQTYKFYKMKILYDIENNYKNITFDVILNCRIDDQIVSISEII